MIIAHRENCSFSSIVQFYVYLWFECLWQILHLSFFSVRYAKPIRRCTAIKYTLSNQWREKKEWVGIKAGRNCVCAHNCFRFFGLFVIAELREFYGSEENVVAAYLLLAFLRLINFNSFVALAWWFSISISLCWILITQRFAQDGWNWFDSLSRHLLSSKN